MKYKLFCGLLLCVASLFSNIASATLVILSVTSDAKTGELIITGTGLDFSGGTHPWWVEGVTVTLGEHKLTVIASTQTKVTAQLPDKIPSGTYKLVVEVLISVTVKPLTVYKEADTITTEIGWEKRLSDLEKPPFTLDTVAGEWTFQGIADGLADDYWGKGSTNTFERTWGHGWIDGSVGHWQTTAPALDRYNQSIQQWATL